MPDLDGEFAPLNNDLTIRISLRMHNEITELALLFPCPKAKITRYLIARGLKVAQKDLRKLAGVLDAQKKAHQGRLKPHQATLDKQRMI